MIWGHDYSMQLFVNLVLLIIILLIIFIKRKKHKNKDEITKKNTKN